MAVWIAALFFSSASSSSSSSSSSPSSWPRQLTTHSIRELGSVGHIEDIAVAKDQQGKKLGLRIIQTLDQLAKSLGCYKCILDCSDNIESFYIKCGFKRAGLQMVHKYADDQ